LSQASLTVFAKSLSLLSYPANLLPTLLLVFSSKGSLQSRPQIDCCCCCCYCYCWHQS
jgi:hypothetical protein